MLARAVGKHDTSRMSVTRPTLGASACVWRDGKVLLGLSGALLAQARDFGFEAIDAVRRDPIVAGKIVGRQDLGTGGRILRCGPAAAWAGSEILRRTSAVLWPRQHRRPRWLVGRHAFHAIEPIGIIRIEIDIERTQ